MVRKKKISTKLYNLSYKLMKIASLLNNADIIIKRDKKRAIKKTKRRIARKVSNNIINKIIK